MSKNFWDKLNKPFFCLAPMADVTDAAFRRVIAKYGKTDKSVPVVMWTEFVAADGLAHPKGKEKLLPLLQYSETERPIVAQLFGSKPEKMREAAAIMADLGFDGVDINMGCPHYAVVKQGAGAALMKKPQLAREIIRAAKEGVAGRIPVSVKTRLGYNKDDLENWLPELLAEEPAAITVHCRTRKEMSKAAAHWGRIKRAVEIRDEFESACPNRGARRETLIIGNGDAVDMADARKKVAETGADGVMFGRAIFGNPFLFSEKKCPEGLEGLRLKLKVLVEHTKLFEKLLGDSRSFALMKKHFKAYVTGWDGAKDLRLELMGVSNAKEVEEIVKGYLKQL